MLKRMLLSSIKSASAAVLLLMSAAGQAGAQQSNATAAGADGTRRHALSLMGDVKYPADFKHFDYVNPQAPKGGSVRLSSVGKFDSLNEFLFKGVPAVGLGLTHDRLMSASLDEASTEYCNLCEWVSHPADFSSVTFKLRDGASWHDGKPITTDDVVFSLESLKAANPREALYYKNISRVEVSGERQITFHFDVKGNRELPTIMGQLTILPKHYWTAQDKDGKERNILNTTLEAPLGSGPYKIKEFVAGRSISYERVANYWGKDLAVAVGQYNFDQIRFEYFSDPTPALEAFKVGQVDFYRESSAKNWATEYNFKAITTGAVKKREISLRAVNGMQGLVFNLRRSKFQDRKIRQAFNLAYDFEWANANLFYGQYIRSASYFENSDLAARGLPTGLELEILNTIKDQVPADVFEKEYKNPTNSGGTDDLRANLASAAKLFTEAGWRNKNGVLTDAKGQTMTVEFLLSTGETAFERVIQPFIKNLERLGVKASIRLVDGTQHKRRVDTFDYDIIIGSFPQSESPGNEQRYYWTSPAADEAGSHNYAGIKDPAVDKLVNRLIMAQSREELVATTKALDRVLLWNQYVVPQWYLGQDRVAYWDRFGEPRTLPSRSVGFLSVWWYDDAKAKNMTTKP